MQVDILLRKYLKAQEETETHVDMWTKVSTSASKAAQVKT